MNDIEKKKLGMYGEVLNLIKRNPDVSSDLDPVSSLMAKLSRTIEEIEQEDKNSLLEVPGFPAENDMRRDNLVAGLVPISSALFNYARQSSDIELRNKSRLNANALLRLQDGELLLRAEDLRLLALRHLCDLRKMGITPNLIHNLSLNIEYFRSSIERKLLQPKADLGRRKHLTELFLIADQIMENTDKLIKSFSESFGGFYDEYISLRNLENQNERKALMDLMEDEER